MYEWLGKLMVYSVSTSLVISLTSDARNLYAMS